MHAGVGRQDAVGDGKRDPYPLHGDFIGTKTKRRRPARTAAAKKGTMGQNRRRTCSSAEKNPNSIAM
jgi:hypothetical protein